MKVFVCIEDTHDGGMFAAVFHDRAAADTAAERFDWSVEERDTEELVPMPPGNPYHLSVSLYPDGHSYAYAYDAFPPAAASDWRDVACRDDRLSRVRVVWAVDENEAAAIAEHEAARWRAATLEGRAKGRA